MVLVCVGMRAGHVTYDHGHIQCVANYYLLWDLDVPILNNGGVEAWVEHCEEEGVTNP